MSEAKDPEIGALATIFEALSTLDSDEARQRVLDFAAAKFNLKKPTTVTPQIETADETSREQSDEVFFSKFEHTKPAANVALLVARHYQRYGTEPFTVAEIKDQADASGLVVPTRIDMTLKDSGRQGRRFYQKLAPGKYRVTVHGETYIKETYGAKKGFARKATEHGSSE